MNGCILVVDDNAAVSRALEEALTLLGYRVVIARSVAEGWRLFEGCTPCAVLTDNRMSGDEIGDASGLDLAIRVKSACPAMPVVMLSALPPEGSAEVCDVVLTKPVSIRTLAAALESLGAYPQASS